MTEYRSNTDGSKITAVSGSRAMIRPFIALLSGTAGAQAFTILLVPFVTRLYSPEHYGQVALVFSIAVFLSMISFFGYNNAVLLPESNDEALRIFMLSAAIMVAFVLALVPLCLIVKLLLRSVEIINKLGNWILAVPPTLLLLAVGNLLQVVNIRMENYRSVAGAEIVSGVATPGLRIGFGHAFGSTLSGLVAGMLIALFLRASILFASIKSVLSMDTKAHRSSALFDVARKYKDFPQLFLPNLVLNALASTFPIIVLGQYFASEIVGFYAIADRVIKIPLNVVADSIQKVLIPAFAEKKSIHMPLMPILLKSFLALAALGVPPVVAFLVFGEYLLTLFLSPNWQMAGHFAVLLIPALFSEYVHRPAAAVFLVLRRQDIRLKLQVFKGVTTIGALICGSLVFEDASKTIFAYSLLVAASNCAIIFMGFWITSQSDRSLSPA